MGISTIVAMGIGFLRAKVLALSLGPSGLGILSQALTFFQSGETICSLGIGVGVTKYVSQLWKDRDDDGLRTMVHTSIIIQAAAFSVFFILASFFLQKLSMFLFSSENLSLVILLIEIAVAMSIFAGSFEAILIGIGRQDIFSKARIIYYTGGFFLLCFFVLTYKLTGGFIYIFGQAALSFGIVVYFLNKTLLSQSGKPILGKTDRINFAKIIKNAKKLLSYGGVMLFTSAVSWLAILYVRSLIIRIHGDSVNGFYQVIFALVSYYTPFFTNGLWGYLFPKLSSVKDSRSAGMEVNNAFRFITVFLTPCIAAVYLLKQVLVILIFSEEFYPALSLFPFYLLGSLFFILSNIFAVSVLARKRLKFYFTAVILQNIFYAGLFSLLIQKTWAFAIPFSFMCMSVFGFTLFLFYNIRALGVNLTAANVKLLAASVVMNIIILFLKPGSDVASLLKWPLVAFWVIFAFSRRERAYVSSLIRKVNVWRK